MAPGYDRIACEYYRQRHVTSRNFDSATKAFLAAHPLPIPSHGSVLDLGCGRGQATRYCRIASDRIVQCDISKEMLVLQPREASRQQTQCDARQLPFADGEFSAVLAFLFDAFNTLAAYREIARVLAHDGLFAGTIPHYTWGSTLRRLRKCPQDKTRFVTADGEVFETDSFLTDDERTQELLSEGGLTPVEMIDLCLPTTSRHLSPDILDVAKALNMRPHELPIVKLILARRLS